MYEPAFKTLRVFGFLPFLDSTTKKPCKISKKSLYWSYIFFTTLTSAQLWRVYFYIYTAQSPTYKSYIYHLLLGYEPLINLFYVLVIIYPILLKRRNLQKCFDQLKGLQLQNSTEKSVYYIIIVAVYALIFSELLIDNFLRKIDAIYLVENMISVMISSVQSMTIMFNCIFYYAILGSLNQVSSKLKAVGKVNQLGSIIEDYTKCVSLLKTFDRFNYFVLRNFWLHCAYDMVCVYKGAQVYWERSLKHGIFQKQAISDIIASYWNIYNVVLAFMLFHFGQKLQEKISEALNNFTKADDAFKSKKVKNFLMRAAFEAPAESILGHTEIFRVFTSMIAYLVIVEQLSDFVDE